MYLRTHLLQCRGVPTALYSFPRLRSVSSAGFTGQRPRGSQCGRAQDSERTPQSFLCVHVQGNLSEVFPVDSEITKSLWHWVEKAEVGGRNWEKQKRKQKVANYCTKGKWHRWATNVDGKRSSRKKIFNELSLHETSKLFKNTLDQNLVPMC